MGYEPTDWEREWGGLEPEPPRRPRAGMWLGLLLLFLMLLGVCGLGGYIAWQRLIGLAAPDPILEPPTAGEDADTATATPLSLAPTVTLPGESQSDGLTVARVATGPMATAPQIDANLSEWEGVPAVESAYTVYRAAAWDGTEDLTAVWHLAWDADNLYLAAEVSDDVHVQTQSGNQIFRGDSLELQIDTDRAGDLGSGLNADDVQINLSPGNFADLPPSAFRFLGGNDAPGADIRVAAQPTDTGYVLEAAVPWRDIGVAPTPGLTLGLALNANDNDTPGTAVQEVLKSHVPTRTFSDPTTWGTLTLTE